MGQRGQVRRHCKSHCLGKFQFLPIGDVDVLKKGVTQVVIGTAGEKSFWYIEIKETSLTPQTLPAQLCFSAQAEAEGT